MVIEDLKTNYQAAADHIVKVMENESSVTTLSAPEGILLADLLSDNGIEIARTCGGKGLCKKCTVSISGAPCLACQTRIHCDITVCLNRNPLVIPSYSDACPVPEAVSSFYSQCFYSQWGLAIDIGTTTLHMSLTGGGKTSSSIGMNPQTAWGADIISRIESAMHGGLPELTGSVRAALREMILGLAGARQITPDEIDGAVITGNTTMLYLLTGKNPAALGKAPFEADCVFGETITSRSTGLGLNASAAIYIPRCIAAFAGADIVTAILASGMADSGKTALLADVGTNGELALMHGGRLYCTSTAAGPAFEGYGLSCGSYGITGAIDKVWAENGKMNFTTIGHAPAIGICGSGIVDALAVMLDLGLMDETGYLGQSVELHEGIGISCEDVRKIQLAKSALRAGIETLAEIAGIKKTQIEDFYMAGGFGNYLDLRHAAKIGLIPSELLPVTRIIGNAAHKGAAMLLQDSNLMKKTAWIAESAEVIPLTSNPVFSEYFLKYMMF